MGTFAGVFTPSILTILGIILFRRLGYIVGTGGLERALLIIALANVLSIVTSLSLSAIATNLRVKAGGDYYLISRTLGLGFGGAIGLVLFFAQSLSIGFYCIGFGEALAEVLGLFGFFPQLFAGLAILVLFGLAWAGADWATRFQYVIMALLAASLIAFAWGAWHIWNEPRLAANLAAPPHAIAFWTAFAIFFPAVTGFTQGVSMSGELKKPSRSLPIGTLVAVLLSFAIYAGSAILFAGTLPATTLANDFSAMRIVAAAPFLIDAGVFAATLSSALASFLGAPRILQSLAGDKVFPFLNPFAKGAGPTQNPRRAVVFSLLIALATAAAGNLNFIASVVSMFFLISYGLLNYATYYEARGASPFFRPTFRFFDHRLSLVGAVGCFGAMVMIDVTSAAIAGAILFGIIQYVRLRAVPARWADSRRSYYLHTVRENLLEAAKAEAHPRDWRPMLLVFTEDPERREPLLRFASWITGSSGVMMVCRVIVGEPSDPMAARDDAVDELAAGMARYEAAGFPFAVVTPDLDTALGSVVQSAGIGPVRANTVVVNWADAPPWLTDMRRGRFSRNLRMAFRLGCNLLVLNASKAKWTALAAVAPEKRMIDVWWSDGRTNELALILAHLMTRNPTWSGAKIRVIALVSRDKVVSSRAEMEAMLEDVRIPAEPVTVIGNGVVDLCRQSQDASLVFVPFRLRGGKFLNPAGGEVGDILQTLPIAVLVTASQTIDLDADPDQNGKDTARNGRA